MKIYVSHATLFDYKHELYEALKDPMLHEHEFFLPHEQTDIAVDTREIIKSSDFILAEVSYPSTGQGIELAWAHDAGQPIVCLYKHDASFSNSLRIICKDFVSYTQKSDLPRIISHFIHTNLTRLWPLR